MALRLGARAIFCRVSVLTVDVGLPVNSWKTAVLFAKYLMPRRPRKRALDSKICDNYPGVVGLGVVAFGVVDPLSPAALLFLLDFFSLVPGVVGLFSPPFVPFLTGAGKSSVFS